MRKLGFLLGLSALFLLLGPMDVLSEGLFGAFSWKGSGGWGQGSQYSRMYQTNTVVTVEGEVVSIDQFTPMKMMSHGVHMTLKTDSGMIEVHLGPAWYIRNQDIKFEPEDKVVIKGSKVTFQGKPIIIAAEITKGESVLALREDNGFPVWSGLRRGR